jgi:hypothetical protein
LGIVSAGNWGKFESLCLLVCDRIGTFPAISFGTPLQMIGVRGLTHDQMKIGFLLFEGGCPKNIRQQIELANVGPK